MKRIFFVVLVVILALLAACQTAPTDITQTTTTLPPESISGDAGEPERLKFEIPIKGTDLTIKVDAQVNYARDNAPSYVCLPAEIGDTTQVAKIFFGDNYASAARIENKDTGSIVWPYKTAPLWMERYALPNNDYMEIEHSLGRVSASGNSDDGSDHDGWQTVGDADGDGRASNMKRTREECEAQAREFISALGLDMILFRTDVLDTISFQNYRFYFATNYGGIPSSIGVNGAMLNYTEGRSEGEYMIIYVGDRGIVDIDARLYQVMETHDAEPLISASEAAAKLLEAAKLYEVVPANDMQTLNNYTIDRVDLVYLPSMVAGDNFDPFDVGIGGLMRNMTPAWCFSTGYITGAWSAMEAYIDARTGEYLP